MAYRLTTASQALADHRSNSFSSWNRSSSSSERSKNGDDASNRIFDDFATIQPSYQGPRLTKNSAIFAMGSCFAREIEAALITQGCKVISVDDRIDRPEFYDKNGKLRSGFFHRFTPFAMLQEFQQAFGELQGWDDHTLLVEMNNGTADLNYTEVDGSDNSVESVLTRRRVAAELVRNVTEADVVILTLGLIESFIHKPTGFHANRVPPILLARQGQDFELSLIDFEETVYCLYKIKELIERYRSTPFQMVVTVSPVPIGRTFSPGDIVIANMTSKTTLRAAAACFCEKVDNANYFPSYEMVMYSPPEKAWRPDRIHVQPEMVSHIVSTFLANYYDTDLSFEK